MLHGLVQPFSTIFWPLSFPSKSNLEGCYGDEQAQAPLPHQAFKQDTCGPPAMPSSVRAQCLMLPVSHPCCCQGSQLCPSCHGPKADTDGDGDGDDNTAATGILRVVLNLSREPGPCATVTGLQCQAHNILKQTSLRFTWWQSRPELRRGYQAYVYCLRVGTSRAFDGDDTLTLLSFCVLKHVWPPGFK